MITFSKEAPAWATWARRYAADARETRDALYCYDHSDDASLVVEGLGDEVWFRTGGDGTVVEMFARTTTGYVPDCSPTGVALGVRVELRDGYWYVPDIDVPVARGTSVYETRAGAVYAARRRWRCNAPGLNSGPGRREARKAVQP